MDKQLQAGHDSGMEPQGGTERVVEHVVAATAETISHLGSGLKSPFHESGMQRVLVGALQMVLAATDLKVIPQPNFAVSLEEWPNVGPVDVALLEDGGVRWAFLELKWGRGTLYNCIWDLAKMAVAVAGGASGSAYLIAGAPAEDWAESDGAELFASGTTRLVDLFEHYPSHWKKWCREVKTHPRFLPHLIGRTQLSAVPVRVRDEEWELRCVRVSPAAGSGKWWSVAPVEKAFDICDRGDPEPEPSSSIEVVADPHPPDFDVQCAEDHRRFDEGDAEALWRLVRNPPRWWRFVWFPGDVDFLGKTPEESWGIEQAELLRLAASIKTQDDLAAARLALETFVAAHPGDPTAISAGRSYVLAERGLDPIVTDEQL